VLVGALALTYGVFFLGAMRMANRAREVAVPDLRGKSVAEATALVAEAGLALKVDPQRRPDPAVAADHVLAQEPDPGFMLRRQRTVRIRVSDGLKAPEVPSVVGQTERTAEITLAQSHVGIAARSEIQTADYPADTIVAQDPPAKGRGSSVSVLVNHGAAGLTFVMPDLIGTFGSQVEQILRQRSFRVAIVAQESYPNVPPGVVVRQTPTAGFQIGPGEAISLTVSR
jgi:serine/threonine-protein kinase